MEYPDELYQPPNPDTEFYDGDVLIARELSKMINAENYEDYLQGVTERIKKETIDALLQKLRQDDDISDEQYEYINDNPNYWKKANPFNKENFE